MTFDLLFDVSGHNNLTLYLISFQLLTVLLKENAPQVKRLPIDESTLQSVTELRIDFVNVSDTDATTLELHVLGCIKGTYVLAFLAIQVAALQSTSL